MDEKLKKDAGQELSGEEMEKTAETCIFPTQIEDDRVTLLLFSVSLENCNK